MKKFNFRRAFGGGEARVACLFDDLAAKQLGSGATHVALCNNIGLYFIHLCKVFAAKFVKDVRTIRRKDDKFETEKVALVDSSNEHESIAEKGGKLPRTILLNEKENSTNFKKYGVW